MREQVKWFSHHMENKLKKNDHKGGWENEDIFWLIDRLENEVEELKAAFTDYLHLNGENVSIVDESVDVANFAMMIADIARKRLS
ncbi:hypothetical protein [Siminovitchia fordii]|uniref:NTP pyrophosphohydrolase MazG putative catalytic core domain-containing protein n=1 Tax=Siminovitchia fordii TaxID=254759 RepID=A0ABQ4KA30_9BACI|nr:hypothetical protein [Siminovitchia fordii]GIN22583.1 hypothetical protein J1TS3_37170 [Siminovitchia fordii]